MAFRKENKKTGKKVMDIEAALLSFESDTIVATDP